MLSSTHDAIREAVIPIDGEPNNTQSSINKNQNVNQGAIKDSLTVDRKTQCRDLRSNGRCSTKREEIENCKHATLINFI